LYQELESKEEIKNLANKKRQSKLQDET